MNFTQVDKTDALDYSMPVSVPSQPSTSYSDVTIEASVYNQSPASSSFPSQSQLTDTSSYMHFGNTSFPPQDQLINNSHESQSMINSNGNVRLVQNSFNDWSNTSNNRGSGDGFLSEEEIRARSNEMLENDDMQTPMINMADDGFGFHSFGGGGHQSYEEDRSHSGKAGVGWLKIKAAMRWGIFIRRKAAQRRAQIVQLDDDDDDE